MKPIFKRKNWIINPQLQYRLIALTGGMIVVTSIVIHILINNFYYKLLKMVHLLDPNNAPEIMEFMEAQKSSFETYSMGAFVVMALLYSFLALIETNRIAGPIYNLTRRLKAFREEGKAEEVRFRKGDYFMDLQNEFNLLLRSSKCVKKSDNSEKGFSLIEVVIVMGVMSVLGLGVMRMTDNIQKSQNSMNTGLATRDLVQDVHAMIGFSEICKSNFQPIPVPADGTVAEIEELTTLDGTVKYKKGDVYENNTLKLVSMQLQNFKNITDTSGRMDLALLMKKIKSTGTAGEFTKFVPIYVTLETPTSANLLTCYAQGGSATSSKAVCEDMGGTFDMDAQRCIFRQIMIDSNDPQTLASSPFNLHVRSEDPREGDIALKGGDLYAEGGNDSKSYFVNAGADSINGGFFFGRHTSTSPWPNNLGAGLGDDFQGFFSIMNDGRVAIGYDTYTGTSNVVPDVPAGGGTWGNPQTRLFIRGDSKTSGAIHFGTEVVGASGFPLNGYLGGDTTDDNLELGSTNPSTKSLALWNDSGSFFMDFVARQAQFEATCVGPLNVCGNLLNNSINTLPTHLFRVKGTADFDDRIFFSSNFDLPTAGKARAFIGAYNDYDDIHLGSENPNVTTWALHNSGNGSYMNMVGSKFKMGSLCIDSNELPGSACGHLPAGSFSNTASEQLKVFGNAVVTGNITAGGMVTASNIVAPSDRRYKKNIKSLDNSLEKLLQLDGVSYDWRKEEFKNMSFDSRKQVGFIAQDLEKVIPEAVLTKEDGYKSVNYISIIPRIIEAIKEIWTKVMALDDQQAELERKIAAQDEQIRQLNAIVCMDHPEAPDCKKP